MANAGTIVVGLIARTENFINGMKKSQGALNDFNKSFNNVKSMLSAGAIAYAFKGLADGVTAFSKATREGEDSVVAFTKALPVLGQIEESFHNMFVEVSGLGAKLEAVDKIMEVNKGTEALFKGFTNDKARLSGQKELNDAQKKYAATMEEIDRLESIQREAKRKDSSVVLQNLGAYKRQALEIYNLETNALKEKERLESIQAKKNAFSASGLSGLGESADNIGLNQFEVVELNLKKMGQWNSESKGLLGIYKESIEAKEKQLELEERAKGVIESIKTEEDLRLEKAKELQELFEKGLLTQDQYDRAKLLDKDTGGINAATSMKVSRSVSIQRLGIGGVTDKQAETNRLLQEQNQILKDTKAAMVMN